MVSDNEPRYRLLDSSGAVVGTIYEQTDGSLALQEATSENEIALQPDGDITAVGSVLRRLGHDEIDVPQTRTLTVADFEGGVLPDAYEIDTGSFNVQSSVVDTGDFALEGQTLSDGTPQDIQAVEPAKAAPQRGDTVEWSVRLTTDNQLSTVYLLTQTNLFFGDNLSIRVRSDDDFLQAVNESGDNSAVPVPVSTRLDEWLTVRVTLGLAGSVTVTLFDSNGDELGTISTTTDLEAGGVGFRVLTDNAASESIYFDSYTVKRRVGEYYSGTQNGTVELGNDVQPSGAIETGPNELPTDTDQAILADQPVTDSLTQGEPVSYGLYVAQQQIARVQAEANGTGGIQHPRLVHDELAVNPTRSADPTAAELGDGNSAVYVSDGSGDVTGDDGDVIVAVNSGGTVKTTTLADFSAL